MQYGKSFLKIYFQQNTEGDKIVFEGTAFMMERAEGKATAQNYTLSFRFRGDALHWEREKEVVIETPIASLEKYAKRLGKEILFGIEEWVITNN